MEQKGFHRKLSAILSADVAGYSRLMQDDEAATAKTLEACKQIISDLVKQHRGRVVDSPWDNPLAEFASVVDAVQCTVAVQKELHAPNVKLPENCRMQFRIGVNLGDVIEEGDLIERVWSAACRDGGTIRYKGNRIYSTSQISHHQDKQVKTKKPCILGHIPFKDNFGRRSSIWLIVLLWRRLSQGSNL